MRRRSSPRKLCPRWRILKLRSLFVHHHPDELDVIRSVEIIGIVVNEKGAHRAINTQAVSTLGFPYSVSPTFLRNNQRQTSEESLDELEKIQNKADAAGLDMVVYISMAFGNPYGDSWDADEVLAAVDILEVSGI